MLYNKMLPDSLKVPVVVRVCNEDPEVLRKHQEIQQSKSVHELSKISNLNELPLPINIQLPDVPLPSLKSLVSVIARVPKKKPKPNPVIEHEDNNGGLYSTVSTPNPDRTYTDDEMLRYCKDISYLNTYLDYCEDLTRSYERACSTSAQVV